MGSLANLRPPWQPGQSGNPAGRPKGSRHKLEEAFLADLSADWNDHGPEAIAEAREKDPVGYVKVVASLLPKKVDSATPLDGISREQLGNAISALESWLALGKVEGAGTGDGEPREAQGLSALPEAG